MNNYYKKYLKYKQKYQQLKMLGGISGIKTLHISVGVPGSGKTTRAKISNEIINNSTRLQPSITREVLGEQVIEHFIPSSRPTIVLENAVRFEADDFPGLYDIDGKIKPFDSHGISNFFKAHQWCTGLVEDAMIKDIEDIYQSNTNLEPGFLIKYLELAINYGYEVDIILPPTGSIIHSQNTNGTDYLGQLEEITKRRDGTTNLQNPLRKKENLDKKLPPDVMQKMFNSFDQNIRFYREIKYNFGENSRNPELWRREIVDNYL